MPDGAAAGERALAAREPAEPSINTSPETIIGFAWAHRGWFWKGVALAMLRTVFLAPLPWMFKVIVDTHVRNGDIRGILEICAVFLVLLALHYVASVSGAYLTAKAMSELLLELRGMVFDKLQMISFGYLDKQSTGRLFSKYAFDTQRIEGALWPMLNQFLPNIVFSVGTICVLLFMNWRLAVALAMIVPIYAVIRTTFHGRMRKSNREIRLAQERLAGTATEYISALRLVRSLGEEKQVEVHMDESSRNYATRRIELATVNMRFGTFSYVAGQVLGLLVVAGGAVLAIRGQMTLGSLTAFVAALPVIMMPIQMIAHLGEQYFTGQEGYRSLRDLLDVEHVENWTGRERKDDLKGEIEFDNVTFTYDGGARPAVRDFSLKIAGGERVAFAGPSGAGKSTIVNLLLGLYRPQHGVIRVDGIPQERLRMRWFRRRKTAVVLQEAVLLSGTVTDNIRFARPDATEAEVREAARQANADGFIAELPNRYDTLVGERGVTLSGGQRQRIAIARAILRNPAILILDEPTSALDYESERSIQQAIDRLSEGRTVITIAHRLSTIRNADRIVVMKEGGIMEQGKFEELVRMGGFFSQLVGAQGAMAL